MHSVMGCLFFLYTRAEIGNFKLTSRCSRACTLPHLLIAGCGLVIFLYLIRLASFLTLHYLFPVFEFRNILVFISNLY
jgi:hypothetical protein